MKKIILLLAIAFSINYINAQEQKTYYYTNSTNIKEIGKLDNDGFPRGEWKYFLIDGALDYSINWEINFIKKYYITGELKEEGTFIPETGTHIKKWTTYHKNGKIKTQKMYDKNGVEKT